MKKLLFPVIALTLILLMAASVSASAEVIWTIGINNNSRIEFKPDSASEIFYKVGDNINADFPSRLDSKEEDYPSYVEIEFTTTVLYADVSLLYDRWGAETDKVWFDSILLGTCAGIEDKDSINYFFDVGVVLPGTYTIKIEILLNGGDGFHGIDQLQLSGNLVAIDIKPGSDPNSINPKSKGVIPVAILGSVDFDVALVDVGTLVFGPDGTSPAHDLTDSLVYADHLQDVNLDGILDLVCHFRTQETGIEAGDTSATLTFVTTGGVIITVTDSVNIVGK